MSFAYCLVAMLACLGFALTAGYVFPGGSMSPRQLALGAFVSAIVFGVAQLMYQLVLAVREVNV